MKGKEKCKALKEIRRQIAEANDIAYAVSECTHQGDCRGTCPKCEAELRYLERELSIRQGLGKAVAVVGLSAGVCASMTACSPAEILQNPLFQRNSAGALEKPGTTYELDGDIALPESTEETPESIEATELQGEIAPPESPVWEAEPENKYTWEIEGDISTLPEPTEEPTIE